MGKSSRDKGGRGEREVAKVYRGRGYDCRRIPNSGGLDVKGDLQGVPGFHLEVKRQEKLNIWGALKQAEDEAEDDLVPALHFRRNNSQWYVAVKLEDFLELIESE